MNESTGNSYVNLHGYVHGVYFSDFIREGGLKMGMTIAEPIQTLEYLKDSGVFPFSTKEGVLYTAESIDVAIDTMRKYQKIEQMLYEFKDMIHAPCLMKGHMCAVHEILKEVVEDGKID